MAAISRVRCFVFGVGISSMAPTGVAQLFIHPKNTTLSFPPPQGGWEGEQDRVWGSQWVGGGQTLGNESSGWKELGPI